MVGVVQTPLYVNFSRGYTTIGTGTLTAFLVVPEEAFTMDVYTDLYLTLQGAKDLNPFMDAYPDLVLEKRVTLIGKNPDQVDICIDSEVVSRGHARIEKDKEKLREDKVMKVNKPHITTTNDPIKQ